MVEDPLSGSLRSSLEMTALPVGPFMKTVYTLRNHRASSPDQWEKEEAGREREHHISLESDSEMTSYQLWLSDTHHMGSHSGRGVPLGHEYQEMMGIPKGHCGGHLAH